MHWMLHYTSRPWYTGLVSLLAGLDLFILAVPTDALAITAVFGKPKLWLATALTVAIGSTIGCLVLAQFIHIYGNSILELLHIEIGTSGVWLQAKNWIEDYGVWAIFLFAVGPLPLQPAIVLAAFTDMTLQDLGLSCFIGRSFKFIFLCWVASHAPAQIERIWGLKHELKVVERAQKD